MTVDTGIAERLIGVLRSATGTPDLEYGRRPEPMQGGFWAELFAFSLANPPAERTWPTRAAGWPLTHPGRPRTSSATAICTRSTCSPTVTG